jgi:nucleoside-diphosphate-sugar epimerase
VPPQPGKIAAVADLADFGQVVGALRGVHDRWGRTDAVVPLGAIPAPGLATNAALFANNVVATHNVFEAARAIGIRRIVWASSKGVDEELARHSARWKPELSVLGLRFSNVMVPADYAEFES